MIKSLAMIVSKDFHKYFGLVPIPLDASDQAKKKP
jgi:hypothetical protein